MTTTRPAPPWPAPEPQAPRHRELRSAPTPSAVVPPDRTRAGVHGDEVPSALERDGYAAEVVRPISIEAAAMWDAALWHGGAR